MNHTQLTRDLEEHIIRKIPRFDSIMSFFLRSQANSRMFLDQILVYFRQSLNDSDKMLIVLTLINFFLDNVPDEYLTGFVSSNFYSAFKAHIYELMRGGQTIPDILFSHAINWQFVFTFSEDYKRFVQDIENYDKKADTGRVADLFSDRLDQWEAAKDRYEAERHQPDLDKMFETYEVMTINEKLDILRKGSFTLTGDLLRRYLACKHYMENRLWERLPPLPSKSVIPVLKKLDLDELYRLNLAYRDKLKREIQELKHNLNINSLVL